jgi:hypothetical protein
MTENQVKCADYYGHTKNISESCNGFSQDSQNTGSGETVDADAQQPEHQGTSDIDFEVTAARHSGCHE